VGVLRTAVKASSYIHLGGGQGYSVPPNYSVIHREDWEPTTTAVGRSVTPESAMSFVPFFAGTRLISTTVGRTPQVLYRRLAKDERDRATDKQLYRILHDEPNEAMSALVFKETLTGHMITRGNCYAEQVPDDLGRLSGLWPFRPDRMQVLIDTDTGLKFYRYRIEKLGDIVDLPANRVFHIPAFGFDGLVGYSLVSLFRQSIAVGLSAEEFGARFFKSGAQPSLVVHHPAQWDDNQVKKFAAKFRGNHRGLSNAQRIAIIEEGISIEKVGMNLDDAQFLETRKFQRNETAVMLGLPPHTLGDLERATFSNIEEQGLDLVTYGFGAWFDRWDHETNRQLVRPAYPDMYAEHLVEALLKGRALDRAKFYQMLWQMGVLNAETIARRENLPKPEDGSGKTYWRPVNYEPALAIDEPGGPGIGAPPVPEGGAGDLPTDGGLERAS
jgi:HK97 family phage portal protein